MQVLKDPILNMLDNLYEKDIPIHGYNLSFLDILINHMYIRREIEQAEIAKMLKISVSTVQKRLARFKS